MASALVPADPDAGPDKEVTWEDQTKLNTFNRLNAKLRANAEEIQKKKELLLQLKDAETDVLMLMEGPVRYQVGEVFFHMEEAEASDYIQRQIDLIEKQISELEELSETYSTNVTLLKRALYDKFGKQINLDE